MCVKTLHIYLLSMNIDLKWIRETNPPGQSLPFHHLQLGLVRCSGSTFSGIRPSWRLFGRLFALPFRPEVSLENYRTKSKVGYVKAIKLCPEINKFSRLNS